MAENEAIDIRGIAEPSAAVCGMQAAWQLVADLMGGTDAMRRARHRRMPQWPSEEPPQYDCRIETATLFPAYSRTVSILTGKPFSKPVSYGDDVPERIRELLDDADIEGRNLHSFLIDVCHDALAYGLCGILVDCPKRDEGRIPTVAEEKAAGVRPYLVHVRHDAILGWKSEKKGSSIRLTQLRLEESVEVDDGPFATKVVKQVRVLTPGHWELYRESEAKDGSGSSWEIHDCGDTSLDEIPFVPVYGRRKDFMIGEPPMLDLAHLNVEHWQSKSDQQTILHVARVPILFLKGSTNKKDDASMGVGALVRVEDPAADMKYVEHSGAAIESGRVSLLDLEDRMRQIGAELLVIKPGNTTIVQTRSDNEPAMCDLQRIMQSMEDGADKALYFMARFLKLPDGGHVSIYSDFGVATLPEASRQLLANLHADGAITQKTLLSEFKRRGDLSADLDVDAEVEATAKAKVEADRNDVDRAKDRFALALA